MVTPTEGRPSRGREDLAGGAAGRAFEERYSVKYATPPSMSGWYVLPGTFL